jgi:murein DD-endopeptidase MepM/ murein hydrolase activator NlpD
MGTQGQERETLKDVDRALRSFEKEARKLERRRRSTWQDPGGSASLGRRFRRWFVAGLLLVLAVCVLVPPYRYPLDGEVTSVFFIRPAPDSGWLPVFEFHRGLDVAARAGTPVRAARSGFVIDAGYSDGYGNYVVLRHLLGFTSLYGHLEERRVGEGRLVIRGRPVGKVGSTGRSTGPHLHFEIRAGDTHLPPGIMTLFHGLRMRLLGW